jgi:hypothetical protein
MAACATCASTTPTRKRKSVEYVELDQGFGAVAGLRLGFDLQRPDRAPSLLQASDYFDFMYRAAEYLIEAGHAYIDEQTAETKCAPAAATSDRARQWIQPLPQSHRPAEDSLAHVPRHARRPATPTAPWCCARRSTWPAPTSTCATRPSTASSRAHPSQHRRQMVHLPDVYLRPPAWKTRWSRHHPQRSAHSSSKTSARSMTGCSNACAEGGLLAHPLPKPVRIRAPEPDLRR